MRSRYCAYVKKEAGYLYRTLHPEHADRARPEAAVMREIRDAISSLRFMALKVLDHEPPDEQGIARVLFFVRVFEKGQNRSFVELSEFARDSAGIRYLRGRQASAAKLPVPPEGLTIQQFEALSP
jgi:SEC-C motif domain protein